MRGFSQVQGTDYNETFALIAQIDTLQLFLATITTKDLECAHFDIKNTFTKLYLKEKIYLSLLQSLNIKKSYIL